MTPSSSTDGTTDGGTTEQLLDVEDARRVVSTARRFEGLVVSVRTDEVDLGDGQTVTRDVVEHPGAVGIIALDDRDRVLLVHQYRHPVGRVLWEPPAGLLDEPGEDPLEAARRELWEETHHRASDWHVLVDYFNSPGGSTESFRCYLARGLEHGGDEERHAGEGEERDMPTAWLDLDQACEAALAGRLHNPTAIVGVLAAARARDRGWSGLRPADAAWPEAPPNARPR